MVPGSRANVAPLEIIAVANVVVEGNNFDGCAKGTLVSTPVMLSLGATTKQMHNNLGINPEKLYAQGNATGATTFNRVNGDTISATLTGNITTTITDGMSAGDRLTLVLTQDGTGSRTVSKPSNVKLVGGAFSPTATAAAVDSWTLVWDGTNWRETSRSLNMS